MRHLIPTLLLAAGLAAQEPGPTTQVRPTQDEPTVSVQFAGGTLAEFVLALRNALPGLNILVPDGAERVRVPAMQIKDAGVPSVLQAVCDIAETRECSLGMKAYGSPQGQSIYALSVQFREARNVTAVLGSGPERRVHVMSVEGLDMHAPAVLSAIEAALEGVKCDPPAKVRFHTASKLVFIEGNSEALMVAIEVVRAIRETDRGWLRKMREATTTTHLHVGNQPIVVPPPQETPKEPEKKKDR